MKTIIARKLKLREDIKIKKLSEKLFTDESCEQCGSTENISLDHIIPYSFLKDHLNYKVMQSFEDEWNFRILCVTCNKTKSNLLDFTNKKTRENFLRYLAMIPIQQ